MHKKLSKMKKIVMLGIATSILLTSCKEKKTRTERDANSEVTQQTESVDNTSTSSSKATEEKNEETTQSPEKGSEAVCLMDISVRETPSRKGKWITSISIGEKVTYMGEKTEDPKSKKLYYKVKLIDGKQGWTRADFFVVNAKVGVLLEDASVYKRPSLVTKTDKSYSKMDIIAVISNQEGWIHVKGKRSKGKYIEEAWIKSSEISSSPIDIATAKFAAIAMNKPTAKEKISSLQEIIQNKDLESSSFIGALRNKMNEYKEKNTVPAESENLEIDEFDEE